MTKKQKQLLIRIIVAAVFFVPLYLLSEGIIPNELPKWAILVLFLIPYLTAGHDVIRKAFLGIKNRRPFDECFLMTVATVGAIVLGEYGEGAAVMLLYQVGELFQGIAVGRSRRNISALMDIRPDYANIEAEDGTLERVDPDEVETGSVIVVQPGEKVPIDGVVAEGTSALDTAALTGESRPRGVSVDDTVLSGSVNLTGVLKIRTTAEFGESTASKILELVENAASRKAKSEHFVAKFARIYTPAVCFAALALAVLPPIFCMITGIGLGGGVTAGHDKTGTITKGTFEVTAVHHNTLDENKLLELAAHAECHSSHPISLSLQRAYGKPVDPARVADVQEISGHGITAKVDGKAVAVGNERLMNRLGVPSEHCHSAGTIIHVAVDGAYAGHFVIADEVKERAKEAMEALAKAGVGRTVMLTGDIEAVAKSVAEDVGISEYRAELLPQDKVACVEELLAGSTGGKKLAFVGDGINDAPVLSRADIGIAMGALGSDAAIEAADVVLMDDDPVKIAKAIRIARKCIRIVRENIGFALGVKAVCLILSALGRADMWIAILADVGVMVLAVLNAIRCLFVKDL